MDKINTKIGVSTRIDGYYLEAESDDEEVGLDEEENKDDFEPMSVGEEIQDRYDRGN